MTTITLAITGLFALNIATGFAIGIIWAGNRRWTRDGGKADGCAMTRAEALAAVIAATEADALAPPFEVVAAALALAAVGDDDMLWAWVVGALGGSLDDAMALHDAVLGGDWCWSIYDGDQASVALGGSAEDGKYFGGFSSSPARAWLLAILRALQADL